MNFRFALCFAAVLAEQSFDDEEGLLQIRNFAEEQISELTSADVAETHQMQGVTEESSQMFVDPFDDDPMMEPDLDPAASFTNSATNGDELLKDLALVENEVTGYTITKKGVACPAGTAISSEADCKKAQETALTRGWFGGGHSWPNIQSGCFSRPLNTGWNRVWFNKNLSGTPHKDFSAVCKEASGGTSGGCWTSGWTTYNGKFLPAYTSHGRECLSEDEAKQKCIAVADCGGINKQYNECGGKWTLRKGPNPVFVGAPYNAQNLVSRVLDRNCIQSGYHLAPSGAAVCDSGTPLGQNDCLAAVQQLAKDQGVTLAGRAKKLQGPGSGGGCMDGSWGQVPGGCSAQTGNDWAAHYKTGVPQKAGCVHQWYQLVCTGSR